MENIVIGQIFDFFSQGEYTRLNHMSILLLFVYPNHMNDVKFLVNISFFLLLLHIYFFGQDEIIRDLRSEGEALAKQENKNLGFNYEDEPKRPLDANHAASVKDRTMDLQKECGKSSVIKVRCM